MRNGLAIIEKTDNGAKCLHNYQENIEFARLNALTQKRIERAAAELNREIQNRRKAEKAEERRKAEKAEARRKAYTLKSVCRIMAYIVAYYAVIWAGNDGMIHPVISIPVSLFFLCAACVTFGAWLGRVAK